MTTSNFTVHTSHEALEETKKIQREYIGTDKNFKFKILWGRITLFGPIHILMIIGLCYVTSAKLATLCFNFLLYQLSMLGITCGAHRLWTHRSYKANLLLRTLLAGMCTLAFQGPIFVWVRDHRVHHKFSDTDADPHNATRGFFFSHIGWLLVRKHPEVVKKGNSLDLSDLLADPVIVYQMKYYYHVGLVVSFLLPTVCPVYFWGEDVKIAFFMNIIRYVAALNATFSVNSAAHLYGNKPYNKNILPAENLLVSIWANGEGWHNYHHTFPWDYKTSEWGSSRVNLSSAFINVCAVLGLAYDLKSVSEETIKNRVCKTGDGSHEVWGWGDPDQPKEYYKGATISHRKCT